MFLVVQYVDGASRFRRVCEVTAATGTGVALYGLLQFLRVDPLIWPSSAFGDRVFSTFGNPGLLGAYLIWPVLLGIGLMQKRGATNRNRIRGVVRSGRAGT